MASSDTPPDLENNDPDTFRIMISTDNHLGFAEKDPVRGDDSFAAFEEMLYLARKFHCDTVLNRPSRRCLHRTMEILRKYCMGDDAVLVQSLSGPYNYLDPNYNVQLPVFSIHGNHDDPSRDQGAKDLLAPLDLLSVTNLVNYFGRQDDIERVEVAPVLLQKGETKVAIYGLGSIREERLNRLWTKEKVEFLKTEEDGGDQEESFDNDDDEKGKFFHIFVLHQNRDVGRGSKNCVQESMIPAWMDAVLWGHEHECLIQWQESVVGTFMISQPGSSVATSLCAGEAVRKKVGILDIRKKQFRLYAIPLTQVRSFVTTEVSLRENRARLDPEDPKVEKKISALLVERAQVMILNAREERTQLLEEAKKLGNDAGDETCPTKFKLLNPEEVLVRIRVEHSGFAAINNQRFGSNFVGDIANLHDILLFHRQKDPKLSSKVKRNNIAPREPEDLERTDIFDLVREYLNGTDEKLKMLDEKTLSDAMEEYVEKSRTSAIAEAAGEQIEKKQKLLFSKQTGANVEDLDDSLGEKPAAVSTTLNDSSMVKDDDKPMNSAVKTKKSTAKAAPKAVANESSDDDVEEVEKPKAQPKPRAKRTAAKRKVAYQDSDNDDDHNLGANDDHSLSEDDFDAPAPKKKAPAAAKKKVATTRQATKPKPTTTKKRSRRRFDSDDDDVEDQSSELASNWGTAATQSQF